MDSSYLNNHFTLDVSILNEVGYNPYYPRIEGGLDDPLIIGGRPFVNLASNNYHGNWL